MSERANLYAAMYEQPEDEEVPAGRVPDQFVRKTVAIDIDGERYEMVNPDYVRLLEERLARLEEDRKTPSVSSTKPNAPQPAQSKIDPDTQRQIVRLENANKRLRDHLNKLVRELDDVWRELERKVDLR